VKIETLKQHQDESVQAAFEDLSSEWKSNIRSEMISNFGNMNGIFRRVDDDRKAGKIIYPNYMDTFRALKLCTPMSMTKVVIIGQDPYHGPGQANGLAFSVKKGQTIPPSLRNIFLELKQDLGYPTPDHGDLTKWARQGVLLLNTSLTVEAHKPASHSNYGWKTVINAILRSIHPGAVGILWGKHAQEFGGMFVAGKVIRSAHPSPFSADKGFFGSKPFSKCNELLALAGSVDWRIE
jgi:uracil-DNA glycosylase